MEQKTDKQMTLAEFKQWVESMEQEAWQMVARCRERNLDHGEIWQHQWVAYKWVLKQLNNVPCE
jgi:hypothetical protein